MRAFLPMLLSAVLVAPCAAQVATEPQYEGLLAMPSYDGGHVMDWDAPEYTKVTVYGLDTKPAYSIPLLRNANACYSAWAVDSDGVAACAHSSPRSETKEGRIDLLDVAGKPTLTIRTGLYEPMHLVFAPDHTLWATGLVTAYESEGKDFNVVRHYSRTGEELGQALPWSKIAEEWNPFSALHPVLGRRKLYCSSDRIGFVSTLHTGHDTWIEVDGGGKLLGKYDLGMHTVLSYQPLAMTVDGRVYARIFRDRQPAGWAMLNREKERWERLASGYPHGQIIGADGDNVIFSDRVGGWTVLHSISSSSLLVGTPAATLTASTFQK